MGVHREVFGYLESWHIWRFMEERRSIYDVIQTLPGVGWGGFVSYVRELRLSCHLSRIFSLDVAFADFQATYYLIGVAANLWRFLREGGESKSRRKPHQLVHFQKSQTSIENTVLLDKIVIEQIWYFALEAISNFSSGLDSAVEFSRLLDKRILIKHQHPVWSRTIYTKSNKHSSIETPLHTPWPQ